jgi:hypothetical protein
MAYEDTLNENDELGDRAAEYSEEDAYGESGAKTDGEGDKIPLAETIIMVLIAATADAFELAAGFTVCIDFCATYGLSLLFGVIASTVIFLWSCLRGTRSGGKMANAAVKKVLIILLGEGADLILGGVLPLRTASLIISILYYNNQAMLNPSKK